MEKCTLQKLSSFLDCVFYHLRDAQKTNLSPEARFRVFEKLVEDQWGPFSGRHVLSVSV